MSRTNALRNLIRALRLAQFCEQRRIPTAEGIERAAAAADTAHRVRAPALDSRKVQAEASRFLADVDLAPPARCSS